MTNSPKRRLRHWRQQFNPNAKFIWRRPIIWKGKQMKIGDPIPKDLRKNKAKLRLLWESHKIELADFSDEKSPINRKKEVVISEPVKTPDSPSENPVISPDLESTSEK